MEIQQQLFDYSVLSAEDQAFVKVKEQAIKSRTAQTIIDNGRDLLEVKERLQHGQFQKWIECNFPWSYETARKMIKASEKFKTQETCVLENFQKEALFLLAAPSTPETARQEAIDRAESGEKVDLKTAKQLKEAHTRITDLKAKKQDLEAEITRLSSELPTKETQLEIMELKTKIQQLEYSLKLEQEKEPEKVEVVKKIIEERIIEKPPDDYEQIKKEIAVLQERSEKEKKKILKELSLKRKQLSQLTEKNIDLKEQIENTGKIIDRKSMYLEDFLHYRQWMTNQIGYVQRDIETGILSNVQEITECIEDIKKAADNFLKNQIEVIEIGGSL